MTDSYDMLTKSLKDRTTVTIDSDEARDCMLDGYYRRHLAEKTKGRVMLIGNFSFDLATEKLTAEIVWGEIDDA